MDPCPEEQLILDETRDTEHLSSDADTGVFLLGKGHPDEGSGPAPLPLSNHSLRLMCSGGLVDKTNPGILLVKSEWDAADGWLTEHIDNKEQQQ